MGVKVRERNGAWWLFIDHKGKRKAKRVWVGAGDRKAANAAAEKIQARLALGDSSYVEEHSPVPDPGNHPS
jgi:integrase